MSIILAIEPDRRRAAQLTGMARAHLRAELLVAPTAAQAIEELDGRVPDVLLTAPLLPSHEEATMAEHLRQLGPAAAHVQTLTIPLLAGAGDRDRPVLSAFRRERSNRTEPEGCDPAVFAEQITEYLREAQDRRAAPVPPPRSAPSPVVETTPVMRLATAKNGTIARLLAAAVEDEPDDFTEFLLPPAPAIPFAAPADPFDSSASRAADAELSDIVPDITLARANDVFATDAVPMYERDTIRIDDEPSRVSDHASSHSAHGVALLDVEDNEVASDDLRAAVEVPAGLVTPTMRRRARRGQAVDDKWEFFDPNQWGFPALIAKLDEIASRESDS